ncbi:MAG: hypothetical protein ACI9OJ_002264 [Myxococcota bacterium]|jgi:hypothetical protein
MRIFATAAVSAILCFSMVSGCSADAESSEDAGTTTDTGCDPSCPDDVSGSMIRDSPDMDSGEPLVAAYHIGTNVPGETSSQYFTVAESGMTVSAVLGSQGAWMVVVAARTNQFGCCVKRVDVEASITGTDGTVHGQLKYKRRPLFDGGDGFRYLMNTFVVVGDPAMWAGAEADMSLSITPTDGGETLESTVRVSMKQVLAE